MENINILPLVSCTVLCYNSAKTVIETLESIKAQTYRNIELVVSDDCSKDDTVELCRQWINLNKERFVRTELLTVEKNTGVCANANRALSVCRGEWKKGIAADDILFPNCVTDFVSFVKNNPKARWVSSYVRVYRGTFDEDNCIKKKYSMSEEIFDMTLDQQLRKLAFRNIIYAPSLFVKMDILKELDGYDTQYVAEDFVFNLKVLENGYRCFFMPIETVGYRLHQSISNSTTKIFNYDYRKGLRKIYRDKCFQYLSFRQKFCLKVVWFAEDFIAHSGFNKKSYRIVDKLYRGLKKAVFR